MRKTSYAFEHMVMMHRLHESHKACCQKANSKADDQYSYSDIFNRFLSEFLPQTSHVEAELSYIDWDMPKAKYKSQRMEEILSQLSQDLNVKLDRLSWFVTGEVDPSLFSEKFKFVDDSVSTEGIKNYARGVRKLFDQASEDYGLGT
jgi:hypothetical protein